MRRWLLGLVVLMGWSCVARAQEPAADKPLPDAAELLQSVEAHEDANAERLKNYTYHVHHVREDFDGNEAVKKTTVTELEAFYVAGHEIRRVVARDGTPLDAEDAAKENERVDKEIEKAKKERAKEDAKKAEGKTDPQMITAARVLELGTFSNERRVMLNGRATIVLDFAGKHDAKTRNDLEKIVEDLVGTVWVDEADRVIARTEGHFLIDYKVGFGMVADVHKGMSVSLQQTKINGEIWLPQEIHGQGKLSLLMVVVRVHGRVESVMSDYRKYRTGVTVLGSNGEIGEDGKPKE